MLSSKILYYVLNNFQDNILSTKLEEILPKILKHLSSGIGVSSIAVAETHSISASGVRARVREIKKRFYPKSIKYDGSTKKWVAAEASFLNKSLLKPEEVVILNAILRNKNKLGKSLAPWHEKMVESYVKRAHSYIYKQHIAENITASMQQTFAVLQNAIDDKKKVQLSYSSKIRIIYPYKIVYIEYYWYLICYEESDKNKVVTYRLSKINDPHILDETYYYDFLQVDQRLQLAMNAYIDFQEPIQKAIVLVSAVITEHVELASFFNSWKKLDCIKAINNVQYTRFEVKFTNPQYNDIIPTILKYMPNIIVEEPEKLKEKIDVIITSYMSNYNSVGSDKL